jgi:hypothetical protein
MTVELLCADTVYYADPSTFNDPLDTKPCVEADCDIPTMEHTLSELVRRRVEAEMRSQYAAQQQLARIRHEARDPEYGYDPSPLATLLAYAIERELLKQYNKRILSLATRHDCPLMWSDYGAQHRGICIGYSVPPEAVSQLHEVRYGGSRKVPASAVAGMVLQHNEQARAAVDEAVLLRKAPDWRYEDEWRLLGARGAHDFSARDGRDRVRHEMPRHRAAYDRERTGRTRSACESVGAHNWR